MYLPRYAERRLRQLLAGFPAVVVTGARQVGKSTLLRHYMGDEAEFVVFDPVVDVENARNDPELFLANHRTPLVLDEVQYASEVLGSLKRRIDADRRPGQYLLTGSQQWGVLKSVAESLAGRVALLELDGFALGEIAEPQAERPWLVDWLEGPEKFAAAAQGKRLVLKHNLLESLWRGFLPEAQFLSKEIIPDFHLGYQRTYIERDARLLADVSDWQQFGRFMRLVAALTACELNHSELGREIGITPQTSKRWLDVLRASFQWYDVPAYAGNTIKRISGRSKGFFADTGVVCASLAISSPAALASHPNWGAVFETAVYAEVRKALGTLSSRPNVYHWRIHSGAEVDILLERDGMFFPIEVKAHSRPSRKDTQGISSFRAAYPKLRVAPGAVVCPCEQITKLSENDWAVPWDAACVA